MDNILLLIFLVSWGTPLPLFIIFKKRKYNNGLFDQQLKLVPCFLFSVTKMVAFYSRTSRNRRKAEQKKWKLKEGSPYEDFALIAALSKIITAVDIMRGNVFRTCNCRGNIYASLSQLFWFLSFSCQMLDLSIYLNVNFGFYFKINNQQGFNTDIIVYTSTFFYELQLFLSC